MKPTLTLIHGVADYMMAALLLVAPWLFGFSHDPVAASCTLGFGLTTIGYSLFTDYELAARRLIPMPAHLALDAVCGGLLIGAPFMMGFAHTTWVPHLVMGCVECGAAIGFALLFGILRLTGRPQIRRTRGMAR